MILSFDFQWMELGCGFFSVEPGFYKRKKKNASKASGFFFLVISFLVHRKG